MSNPQEASMEQAASRTVQHIMMELWTAVVEEDCSNCCLLHAGFLLGLLLDHEDGGDMCLQNIG
jgi:hypothetical protein